MKFTFRSKMISMISIPLIIIVGLAIYANYSMKATLNENIAGTSELMEKIAVVESLKINFGVHIQEWKNALLRGHDPEQREKYIGRLKEEGENMIKMAGELKSRAHEKEEIELLELFIEREKILLAGYLKSYEAHLLQGIHDYKAADKSVSGLDRNVLEPVKGLNNFYSASLKRITDSSVQTFNRSVIFYGSAIFLLGLFVVIVSTLLVSSISGNLLKVADQLGLNSQQLRENSKTLSQRSESLAAAVTEQAEGLHETISTVDEINSMVGRNSEGAKRTLQMSKNSFEVAEEGKKTVQQMIHAIGDISKGNEGLIVEVNRNNDEISQIVAVIREISEKTKVINDIVFQTKLLSFNASVEAARAGENGKGFAVVAEEVGNLAEMSGTAATEIATLLEGSVHKVSQIVEQSKGTMGALLKQTKNKSDQGTQVAQECGQVFENVLANVAQVNSVVEEISSASQEQAKGVNEIQRAVAQLDEVTQSNSKIAGETSEISTKLSAQANDLNHLSERLCSMLGVAS